MSQWDDSGFKSFPAGAAMAANLRVKLVAGVLQLAGSTDVELGTLVDATFANTNFVSGFTNATVRLRTKQGTALFTAAAAITAANAFYAAANGKVDASGTILMGVALETTTASGDIFEGLRREESSDSSASGGTTASAFLVDSDSTTPKIELAAQTGGTGDFKGTIKPPATLTGNRVYTLPSDSDQTLVGATATQTLTNKTVQATGAVTSSSPSAGIGYATGAGAAVAQLTDRTTGVTINAASGAITTQATSLAAAGEVSFTVTNSAVAVGDVVVASIRSGPTATTNTFVTVTAVAAGSFQLTLNNPHASTADTGAAIINFAVIKAVSA